MAEPTGGIDLGGTKIEARLFGGNWQLRESRRVPTPAGDYDALVAALVDQMHWLCRISGAPELVIGIGSAGFADRRTGLMVTANLPATGRPLAADLAGRFGRPVPLVNDCRAFTLSEAVLGAGRGHRTVAGLVLGTGVAGGFAVDGRLLPDLNGISGEFGHLPVPAHVLARHGLMPLHCGCGRTGCYETYLGGPGLVRLAGAEAGQRLSPAEIAAAPAGSMAAHSFAVWLDLLADLMGTIMLTLDPECIVLGGGLSNLPHLAEAAGARLQATLLPGTRAPAILLAEGGDSSGTRGAALAARMAVGDLT